MIHNILIHSLGGLITGGFFLVIGIIIISKKRNYRLNQTFMSFFVFLGLYQLLDSLLLLMGLSHEQLSLIRNFGKIFLILGGISMVIGTQIIKSSSKVAFSTRNTVMYFISALLFLLFAIFGESNFQIRENHIEFERNIFGWIGIFGFMAFYTSIILYNLMKVINDAENPKIRGNMKTLMLALIIISLIFSIFELSYSWEALLHLMEIPVLHYILHGILILDALLILFVFQ